jgi:hypothetical protein
MRAQEVQRQLLEEERKVLEVQKSLSPESGLDLGKGIGDFPPVVWKVAGAVTLLT